MDIETIEEDVDRIEELGGLDTRERQLIRNIRQTQNVRLYRSPNGIRDLAQQGKIRKYYGQLIKHRQQKTE